MTLPDVRVSPLGGAPPLVVECPELQWLFVVPRVGETCGTAWYDRATGELTRVQETAEPVADAGRGDGTVLIGLNEWNRAPDGTGPPSHERISIVAVLTAERAEFRSVTTGTRTTEPGDAEFAYDWAGGGLCRVVDDGRFHTIGEGRYRTTTASGIGAGMVELAVDDRRFRCLRALDTDVPDGTDEIGQPLIDLDTGRTLAYWQYRPAGWDAASAAWLTTHPGDEIVIDDVTFQRRNCTGRDEVALARPALGL